MAARRGEVGQILSLLFVLTGVVLIISAGCFVYLGGSFLDQIPLNMDQNLNTIAVGDSRILSVCSLSGKEAAVLPAKVRGLRKLITVQPASMRTVTYQMNSLLVADWVKVHNRQRDLHINSGVLEQKPCEDAVINGLVDIVTVNRQTGLPVNTSDGTSIITLDPTRAPRKVVNRQGFSYRFQPHLNAHSSYNYFDEYTEQSVPLTLSGSTVIEGVRAWHYRQSVPERDLSELTLQGKSFDNQDFNSPPALTILDRPASWWKIRTTHLRPRTRQFIIRYGIIMHRFGVTERDIWVDPTSGVILKMQEHHQENYHLPQTSFLNRTPIAHYSLTVYDGTQVSDDASVSQAIVIAQNYGEKTDYGSVVIPLIFLIGGVIVLITGVVLLVREIIWRKQVDSYVYRMQFDPLISSHSF